MQEDFNILTLLGKITYQWLIAQDIIQEVLYPFNLFGLVTICSVLVSIGLYYICALQKVISPVLSVMKRFGQHVSQCSLSLIHPETPSGFLFLESHP